MVPAKRSSWVGAPHHGQRSRELQTTSVVCSVAHEDMDVWVVGLPVIDRDPFQLGPEVVLGVFHEFTREGANVRHLRGILRRDDEPEMMRVFCASLGERLPIRVVGGSIEEARVLAIVGHAFALEIGEMPGERHCDELAAAMTHDSGHDDDAPGRGPGRQREDRAAISSEGRSRAVRSRSAEALSDVTCLPRGAHDLADKADRTLGAAMAGPVRPGLIRISSSRVAMARPFTLLQGRRFAD
jgi:hypothetical protein